MAPTSVDLRLCGIVSRTAQRLNPSIAACPRDTDAVFATFVWHRFIRILTIATEFRDRRHREERKHRLNREIMAPEVRLSGPENEPLGIVSLAEALRMAGELDVDLVEIAATANPPVCRLMDTASSSIRNRKRRRKRKPNRRSSKSRKSSSAGHRDGDYKHQDAQYPALASGRGRQVQITLRFRGREITHQKSGWLVEPPSARRTGRPDRGRAVSEAGRWQMIMMIAPGKKKWLQKPAAEASQAASA
jgi:translation initiation factor IF-3